nr:uncharacterized protein LOC113807006 [Penaeus vannamei]
MVTLTASGPAVGGANYNWARGRQAVGPIIYLRGFLRLSPASLPLEGLGAGVGTGASCYSEIPTRESICITSNCFIEASPLPLSHLQVCHNKSGEINPTKIRGLVQGYIKKVKYYRKKQSGPADQNPAKPTAIDPPVAAAAAAVPTFTLVPKATKPPTPIKNKA